MSDFLVEVRCRGCRTRIGVAPRTYVIWCDAWCAADFPARLSEDRDALIQAIYDHTQPNRAELGRSFGMSRQRINQILQERDLYGVG